MHCPSWNDRSLLPISNVLVLVLVLLTSATFSTAREEAPPKKIRLRAMAFNFPPLLMVHQIDDKNFTLSGVLYDIMNILEDTLHIKFDYFLEDPLLAAKVGTPKAGIVVLQQGRADLVPYLYVQSYERSQLIEISHPLLHQQYGLLNPRPEQESRLLNFAKPFSWEVWLGLLVSSVVIVAFLIPLIYKDQKSDKIIKDKKNLKRRFFKNAFRATFIMISRDGNSLKITGIFKFLFFGTWLLMTTILVYSYQTTLISHLTVTRLKPIPHSFEDLANEPNLKLTVERDYILTQSILNASSGPMKKLGDSLRQNQHLITKTTQEAVGNVLKHGCVYAGAIKYIRYQVGRDYRTTGGQCRYAISKILPYSQSFGLGLPLMGPYNNMINKQLQQMFETNIFDEVYRKYDDDISYKFCELEKKSAKLKVLQLEDVAGGFLVLIIGMLIAFITFLLEKILHLVHGRV